MMDGLNNAAGGDGHLGQLRLRRFSLGELPPGDSESARAHLDGCAACRAKARALDDEQRAFTAEMPFERFEAGVRRARRTRVASGTPRWMAPVMAIAAALVIAVGVRPLLRAHPLHERNGLKGGAAVELVIAAPGRGPQRVAPADVPEMLGPGERVRIGYESGPWKYLVAVSVDAEGQVTPLYPQTGASVPTEPAPQVHYLPGAFEFTGKGAERVVVVMSEQPLPLEQVQHAARAAFDEVHGDILKMRQLQVVGAGEQFNRTLLKP